MLHCIAFSESQDPAAALVPVAGVPDQTVRVTGDDIVVPTEVNQIIGAAAFAGATATRGRLMSPSLRRVNGYAIRPLVLALVPPAIELGYLHPESPMPLDVSESLNAEIASDPAAAEQASVVVFLSDKAPSPVSGKIYRVRFTVTVALVAGQWANAAITFPDDLPSGVYRCVGASLVAATAVAARFVPIGQKWRPGFIVGQLLSGQMDERFRNGRLGEWFSFEQTQPPTIDVLSSAAAGAATYEGVMDVIPA